MFAKEEIGRRVRCERNKAVERRDEMRSEDYEKDLKEDRELYKYLVKELDALE